ADHGGLEVRDELHGRRGLRNEPEHALAPPRTRLGLHAGDIRMSRATRKNSIQSQLSTINKSLERELRAATGADSPAIRQAGNALARAMREQLGRAGGARRVSLKSKRVRGEPSAPGEAPRKQTGSLQKSIKNAVVE